jgi:RHS repeat-associated protein
LAAGNGTVLERYEYDAYGEPTIWDATFSSERSSSSYDNPYYFTGRRADFLDGGDLTLQINRHRYYDYYTGRWLTQDPLGTDPGGKVQNAFWPSDQYFDGLSLYEYGTSNPLENVDAHGTSCAAMIAGMLTCTDCIVTELPVPWAPPPPGHTGWYDVGVTTPTWVASPGSCNAGCEGSCERVIVAPCTCFIHMWYFTGSPWRDRFRNNPERHEKHHAALIRRYWRRVQNKVRQIMKKDCMCGDKAQCYGDAIDFFEQGTYLLMDAENCWFDWLAYQSLDPGEAMSQYTSYVNKNNAAQELLTQAQAKEIECRRMR